MKLADLKNVFIVAELSANHNQSLDIAIETIKAAKRAGADAIKLQTYTPETMTLDLDSKEFIINNGSIWDGQKFYDLYKEAHTPWEWHKHLFETASNEGLICFSSPFDRSSVDFLEELGNPIYKVASFEITDLPLIEYIASKGKPIILSTGIALKSEIIDALKTIQNVGSNEVAILKCTSSYPAPPEEANLIMIREFAKEFNVITGLSDHTLGVEIPIVATALGARIIEKHFILDKNLGGPDATFSLDEEEFSQMVRGIRMAEASIGKKDYKLTEKQQNSRYFSRSLYAVKPIAKGEKFTLQNVKSLRPNNGLSPRYLKTIINRRATCNIQIGEPLNQKHFI